MLPVRSLLKSAALWLTVNVVTFAVLVAIPRWLVDRSCQCCHSRIEAAQ